MRCLYCHNPDTWEPGGGTEMTAEEILSQFQAARHFYTNGGITVSGGEPLLQMEFVTDLFEKAARQGIHTCLDTSGITFQPEDSGAVRSMDRLMDVTRLVMLDIKHIDPEAHQKLCGHSNRRILGLCPVSGGAERAGVDPPRGGARHHRQGRRPVPPGAVLSAP